MRRTLLVVLLVGSVLAAVTAASAAVYTCEGEVATHVGTPGDDVIDGTEGDDVIVARGGNDIIRGRGGDDIICAGVGDDEARGGAGNDIIRGGRGQDVLIGGAGSDRLQGLGGADIIYGRSGHDELFGNRGRDRLMGNRGNDYFNGGYGVDKCFGGRGTDTSDSCETASGMENEPPSCALVPNADLRGCDLNGLNLDGLDLSGINFSGGEARELSMRGTIFDGANLSGATLSARYRPVGNVKDASFVGTNLSGAKLGSWRGPDVDLTGADLSGVTGGPRNGANESIRLDKPILVNANLAGADIRGGWAAYLLDGDFSGADLTGLKVDWISGDFTTATMGSMVFNQLSGVGLDGKSIADSRCESIGRWDDRGLLEGDLTGTSLAGMNVGFCDLRGDFKDVDLSGSTFGTGYVDSYSRGTWRNVNLSEVVAGSHYWSLEIFASNLSGWQAVGTYWEDFLIDSSDLSGWSPDSSNRSGVTMRRGSIWETDMTGWTVDPAEVSMEVVTLSGVDLTGTSLEGASLTNVTWFNVTCPDGTNSGANGGTCVGHLTP